MFSMRHMISDDLGKECKLGIDSMDIDHKRIQVKFNELD